VEWEEYHPEANSKDSEGVVLLKAVLVVVKHPAGGNATRARRSRAFRVIRGVNTICLRTLFRYMPGPKRHVSTTDTALMLPLPHDEEEV